MTIQSPFSILVTSSGEHPLCVRHADTFLSRLRGLMLAAPLRPEQGLLITGCNSVHTCFMRQEIDLVYLDRGGVVTKCVAKLALWCVSSCRGRDQDGNRLALASHVLELAAGSIARFNITAGSRLHHDVFFTGPTATTGLFGPVARAPRAQRQKGSAMIEFAVIGPIITLLGLASIQYGLLFFAKNQYNHAAFMAARAGSTGNANIETIKDAYVRALIPLYGGGTDAAKLSASFLKALADFNASARIEILNPTAESFADFYDVDLQKKIGSSSQRVIPNGGLAYKKAAIVPTDSGQNIQDANLLKLRITQAYKPQVPVVGAIYTRYLQWLDTGERTFNTDMIKLGRIPVVTHVTMHMQSDAIEGPTVSTPGPGKGGNTSDPGKAPVVRTDPPDCGRALCTTPAGNPPNPKSGPGGSSAGGDGDAIPGGEVQGGVCVVPTGSLPA